MLHGLATVNFRADDLAAAKQWYTQLFGITSYFERQAMPNSASATTSMNSASLIAASPLKEQQPA